MSDDRLRLARSRTELWRTYFAAVAMIANLGSLGLLVAHYVLGVI